MFVQLLTDDFGERSFALSLLSDSLLLLLFPPLAASPPRPSFLMCLTTAVALKACFHFVFAKFFFICVLTDS